MARLSFAPAVEEIVGKLGGAVFQDSYFGMQVRGWSAPRNPQTQLSQLRRGNFRFLSASWRGLDSISRLSYYDAAGTMPEALRLFIGSNINRLLIGEEITTLYVPTTVPPAFPIQLVDVSPTSITFKAADFLTIVPDNTKLLIFATDGKQPTQQFINPSEFQPITYFEAGTDLSTAVDVFAFWFDKYGYLSPGKFLCIKSVLISSQSGSRGSDSIACGITQDIMTLQQAWNASIAHGDGVQITSLNDNGRVGFNVLFQDAAGTMDSGFAVNNSKSSIFADQSPAGISAELACDHDGSIAITSTTGAFLFNGLMAASDDISAATAGVPVNGLYQNAGILMVRLS